MERFFMNLRYAAVGKMFFVAVVAFVSRSLLFDAKGTHDSHLTFRPMIAEPIEKTVQIWFAKKL